MWLYKIALQSAVDEQQYIYTLGFAYLLEVVSTDSVFPFLEISTNVIPVGSWEHLTSLVSGTFLWLPLVPHPPLLHISIKFSGPLAFSFVSFHT